MREKPTHWTAPAIRAKAVALENRGPPADPVREIEAVRFDYPRESVDCPSKAAEPVVVCRNRNQPRTERR